MERRKIVSDRWRKCMRGVWTTCWFAFFPLSPSLSVCLCIVLWPPHDMLWPWEWNTQRHVWKYCYCAGWDSWPKPSWWIDIGKSPLMVSGHGHRVLLLTVCLSTSLLLILQCPPAWNRPRKIQLTSYSRFSWKLNLSCPVHNVLPKHSQVSQKWKNWLSCGPVWP